MHSEGLIYRKWRASRTNRYFTISNKIKDYLPLVKSPAMNLYLYYSLMADNTNGTSYPSINNVVKMFNVSRKTVSDWNTILVNAGLIARYKSSKTKSNMTQLLPLEDVLIKDLKDNTELQTAKDNLEQLGYIPSEAKTLKLAIVVKKGTPIVGSFKLYKKPCMKNTKSALNKEQKEEFSRYVALKLTKDSDDESNFKSLAKETAQKENVNWITNETGKCVWVKNKGQDMDEHNLKLIIKTDSSKETNDSEIMQTLSQFFKTDDIKKFKEDYKKNTVPSN